MPTGPKGQKRPADVTGNAVHVMRVLTGEETDDAPSPEEQGKDPAAVSLGRKGGLVGGKARADKLGKDRRTEIARHAATERWKKKT